MADNVFQMLAQQEIDKPVRRLRDLQVQKLQKEQDYQTRFEGAMAQPSLANLGPGSAPDADANPPATSIVDRLTKAYQYHMDNGRYAEAQSVLNDQLKLTSEADKVIKAKYASGGKSGVDAFFASHPHFKELTGEPIFRDEDTIYRYSDNGVPSERWGYHFKPDGTRVDVDLTPKETKETWGAPEPMTIGGKTAMVQKSSTGQVRPVIQDTSTTVKVTAGGNPVAQTTFVDPATGNPLTFDKKTGTYRVAIVEGAGVAPKPSAMSPEAAGKAQMIEQGATYIPTLRQELFDPDGSVNRINVANLVAGTAGTRGRELRTLLLDAVEAKLRAESGAAVPEPEVKRAAKRFIPSPLDSANNVKIKLDNLEAYLKGTAAKINTGRGGKPAGNVKGKADPLGIL